MAFIQTALNIAEQKSYNWRYKEETTSRLVGGAEMQRKLVPHIGVAGKRRNISAAEVPPEK